MVDVLAVDDEVNFLKSLAEGLQLYSKKLDVITANSGEKALEILKTGMVDVVVTDLNMPGMGGFEFLKEIQKIHPGLPVIVISACTRMSVEGKLKDLRFAEYIEKPTGLDEIAHAILTLMRAPARRESEHKAGHSRATNRHRKDA